MKDDNRLSREHREYNALVSQRNELREALLALESCKVQP
jgi:hypothetical protein